MELLSKVLTALLAVSVASAFLAPSQLAAKDTSRSHHAFPSKPALAQIRYTTTMNMSPSSSDGSNKRRRKRKDGRQFAPPATIESTATKAETVSPAAQPQQNTVVMQVRDIRSVVSGDVTTTTDVEDEVLGPDEEWEYYDEEEEEENIAPTPVDNNAGKFQDDSMEQLLADARKMRASTSSQTEVKEKSMSDTAFEVISTIVTIDFFVVMGLLVWFLLGIFCSSVLGNDTVQIAFNMNFEKVTQPALGILMIGSVAGGEYLCVVRVSSVILLWMISNIDMPFPIIALGNKDKEEE